jgi:protein-S-isoprenylcysteine O-methyltransferase Ste14
LLGVGGVRSVDRNSDADWERRRESSRSRVAGDFVDGDRDFSDGLERMRRIMPANMFGGAAWLKTASVVVLVAALAIRWTAVFTLGRSFSANVAIRESQKMMRSGLYRVVRHPSYLGLLMVFVAIGIHSRNWISFVVAVVPTTAALIYRIQVEEQALQEAFGEEYAQYSQVTKRLVPGVY